MMTANNILRRDYNKSLRTARTATAKAAAIREVLADRGDVRGSVSKLALGDAMRHLDEVQGLRVDDGTNATQA